MDSLPKCLLCLELADPKYPWESTWSISIANSMEKLMELEEFPSALFEVGDYCRSCKELIRDVDFVTRSIFTLGKRLDKYRTIVAQMLLENFEEWSKFEKNRIIGIDEQETSAMDNAPIPAIQIDPVEQTWNLVDEEIEHPLLQKEIPMLTTMTEPEESSGCLNPELQCSYPACGMKFRNLTALETHNYLHPGWKPFKCPKEGCSSGFTLNRKLNKHLRNGRCQASRKDSPIEMPERKVDFRCDFRPYKCLKCRRGFKRRGDMTQHMRSHIAEQQMPKPKRSKLLIPKRERRFKCWICTATFRRKDHLVRHIKTVHRQQNAKEELAIGAEAENFPSPQIEQSKEESTVHSSPSTQIECTKIQTKSEIKSVIIRFLKLYPQTQSKFSRIQQNPKEDSLSKQTNLPDN